MSYEHKENTGSAFRNDYKSTSAHPDFRGKVNINGQLMDVAVWVKSPDGKPNFLSMAFSEPRQRDEQPSQPRDITPTEIQRDAPQPTANATPAPEQPNDLPF